MGSTLDLVGRSGGAEVLWGEDLAYNYRTLIRNPGLLRWANNPADARLMRFVDVGVDVPLTTWRVPFRKLDLWGRTIALLNARPDVSQIIEFGYDWRAPLLDSADKLASCVKASTGHDPTLAPPGEELRLVLIAHSMGGIVARISIAQGLIHPLWIDRIIHVGTP
jgi:hypothetical protein